jgi:hypothetical protein
MDDRLKVKRLATYGAISFAIGIVAFALTFAFWAVWP